MTLLEQLRAKVATEQSPSGYYRVRYAIIADAPVGGVWKVRYWVGQKIAAFGFWLAGLRNVSNTNV